MALSRLNETTLSKIREVYNMDWSTNDFLVSDEQNLVKIHDWPTHVAGYVIGICSAGTAAMEVNLTEYRGSTNSMIITTPHQVIRILETSADFKARFIIFSKRFLAANNIHPSILDSFQFTSAHAIPVIHLNHEEAIQLKNLFTYIWLRFQDSEHPFRKQITGNLLMALLHDFEAIYQKRYKLETKKLSRKETLNLQFHELLFEQFKNERTVQFYAEKLFVTPKSLTETIKQISGRTAGEWIDAAIVLEAQSLLKNPELTVQQVSNLLNFPDQSSFGKFFKKQVGLSPRDYRLSPTVRDKK